MKHQNEEKIIRFWKLAYAKLFDEMAIWDLKDKKGQWHTHKIFWRFYWLTPKI